MTETNTIDGYISKLARALGRLQGEDRESILAEIRSHLEIRAGQGRLDEALQSLGPPDTFARRFLDELRIQEAYADGGPARSIGTLAVLKQVRSKRTRLRTDTCVKKGI